MCVVDVLLCVIDPCVCVCQKHALMEQVAHQTIVMQFILELAKSLKVDPRGCFRQFFTKIKVCVSHGLCEDEVITYRI